MHAPLFTSVLSFTLLASTAHALALPQPEAYDNGMWTQAGTAAAATSTWASVWTATTTQSTTAKQAVVTTTTAAAATATAATAATQGWEMTAIWPVGCDTWANPCPAGAHMSNGQIAGAQIKTPAGYENGFTSYTTMTNSLGVITGMPSVATVPAGMSTMPVIASASVTANKTTLATSTSTSASTTQSGFQTTGATTTAKGSFTGSAASFGVAQAGVLGAAVAAAMMLL